MFAATPMEADAHRFLGDAYYEEGKFTEAVTAFHVALKLKGDSPRVFERLGDDYDVLARHTRLRTERYRALRVVSP